MSGARDPVHDPARLQEIHDLGLATTAVHDPLLQDLADEAARQLGADTALVTVVLDDAQRFAASRGGPDWFDEVGGTPIEWAFCVHAVRSGQPFRVPDATQHPATKDNPVVSAEGVRSYLGMPLITSRGHVLGTICVIGKEPRTFTPSEEARLGELAAEAVRRLEARRRS
jgi:GAF domain-containing protein